MQVSFQRNNFQQLMSQILTPSARDRDQISETTWSCVWFERPSGWDRTCLRIIVAAEDLKQLSNEIIGAFFNAIIGSLATFTSNTYIIIKSVISLNIPIKGMGMFVYCFSKILSSIYLPLLVNQCLPSHGHCLFCFPCYHWSHQFLGKTCLCWIHCARSLQLGFTQISSNAVCDDGSFSFLQRQSSSPIIIWFCDHCPNKM